MGIAVTILVAIIVLGWLVADKDEVRRQRKRMNRWTIPFCAVGLALFALMIFS